MSSSQLSHTGLRMKTNPPLLLIFAAPLPGGCRIVRMLERAPQQTCRNPCEWACSQCLQLVSVTMPNHILHGQTDLRNKRK